MLEQVNGIASDATWEVGKPPASFRRALLVTNPNARRGEQSVEDTIRCLNRGGLEVFPENLSKRRTAAELIARYRDQIDLVIVAGGDGTINGMVDALIGSPLPLGILPLGTANDLARTLAIPTDLESACQVISAGHTRSVDVGCVNGKYFFNVASIGISEKICQQLTGEQKKRWGVLAYLFTAIRVLLQFPPFHAEIRCGEASYRVKTIQIAVGNGRYYGGGMAVAADAKIDDQQLDLYSLEVRHWWQVIPLMWALRTGDMRDRWNVRTLKGPAVEIHTRSRRRVNTDGEITTHTPAKFHVVPQAIRIFTPARKMEPNSTAT